MSERPAGVDGNFSAAVKAKDYGVGFVDVGVSGGGPAAIDAFMVGSAQSFALRVDPGMVQPWDGLGAPAHSGLEFAHAL